MNKIFSFTCICFLTLFLFVTPVFAHFAATDGNITITLHVDPNDDPTPGQTAHLYFLFNFNDTSKKFHLSDCNCVVTVIEQGKQIMQQRLIGKNNPHLSVWGANMPYVFPKRDVYFITLKGNPVKPNGFKPFFLTWQFRVDSISPGLVTQEQPGLSDIQVLMTALVVVIIALVLIGIFIKKEVLSAENVDSRKKH